MSETLRIAITNAIARAIDRQRAQGLRIEGTIDHTLIADEVQEAIALDAQGKVKMADGGSVEFMPARAACKPAAPSLANVNIGNVWSDCVTDAPGVRQLVDESAGRAIRAHVERELVRKADFQLNRALSDLVRGKQDKIVFDALPKRAAPPPAAERDEIARRMAVVIDDKNAPERGQKARLLDEPTGREPWRSTAHQPTQVLTRDNTIAFETSYGDGESLLIAHMRAELVTCKRHDRVRVDAAGLWPSWQVRAVRPDPEHPRVALILSALC